jgi:uncharacterized SAM-binding protein YcdF (DUF218 family)
MLARAWSLTCRIVGALALAGFAVTAFTPVATMAARRLVVPADVGPADAIVVLGAGANRDGTLSDASLRRAIEGMRLYHRGLAPRVAFLGVSGEAQSRARLAQTLGVPADVIVTEGWQPTTRAEAAWSAEVLGRRLGVRRILLVTDALHMRRARSLFERAGLSVRPAPTDTAVSSGARPEGRLRVARYVAQEVLALAYHRLFGYL